MKTFYALPLTELNKARTRFALYEIKDGKLDAVWPEPTGKGDDSPVKSSRKLLPCQIFYPRPASGEDKFPAYHFLVGNIGYSKTEYLREQLESHFKEEVEILLLQGWSPSRR